MAKFNFLQKIDNIENVAVYQILNKYGKEICEYAKDYFNYIVTYSSESENKKITSISLYILVPEIKSEYNILTVDMSDLLRNKIQLKFYTLITKQTEIEEFDVSIGYDKFDTRINELLSTQMINESFKFLVDHVELKRERQIKSI